MDTNTILINSQNNDPSFNLAAEEYLLRNFNKNIIFLYINTKSVIIGKHQNALSEINLPFLEKNSIPLHRRLSGGGTVYHDEGNINFCLIKTGTPGNLVDFKLATLPIIKALKAQNIEVRLGPRNDLLLGFKKISGNACHVFKSRVMHHGTLLYNSNLNILTESLKSNALKFKDKSVKSTRSEVTNIIEKTSTKKSTIQFMMEMSQNLKEQFQALSYEFTKEDLASIATLQRNRYRSWEWNYGYSPSYEFSKRILLSGGIWTSKIRVEKGILISVELNSNQSDRSVLKKLEKSIIGRFHEKQQLKKTLEEAEEKTNGSFPISTSDLLNLLF